MRSLVLGSLLLVASVVGAWFTLTAFRPRRAPTRAAFIDFLAGWLTGELALHHIAWQAAAAALFGWAGAFERWPGRVGLALSVASWCGLLAAYNTARKADVVVERALAEGLGEGYLASLPASLRAALAPRFSRRSLLFPLPLFRPGVTRTRDVVYARHAGINLRLDVYRPSRAATGCPVLLQVHGGGWVVGRKDQQALPLMTHLAARGWVCVAVNYRLSPHATFPDMLVDLKRALAWIREHIAEYGGDPAFVAVTGGSAGGHLASLVALTADDARYQPGFESVDTHVEACVSFYGVYDFTDRHGFSPNRGLARVLERYVMKAARHEAPEAYDDASPMSRLHPGAPPFFVIHGDRDTMVPVEEARRFVELFRERAHARVAYAELPGAQHAFEVLPSIRTAHVVLGVERFLTWTYARWLERRMGEPDATAATAEP